MAVALGSSLTRHDVDAGGIATVTLADPASRNALSEAMVSSLASAFDDVGRNPRTRVVVLDAEGETFSAGAPRELLLKLVRGDEHPSDITLPRVVLGCPVPVVAILEGHATGGGFALGLAADLIYLATESRYGFTFMNLGFTPGMGTTRLCEHVLSPAVAHELLYGGELRRGSAFAGTGVNGVWPRAGLRERALDTVRRIADKPRASLEALKRTLALPRRMAFEQALTHETLMHQVTFRAAGARQRIEDEYA